MYVNCHNLVVLHSTEQQFKKMDRETETCQKDARNRPESWNDEFAIQSFYSLALRQLVQSIFCNILEHFCRAPGAPPHNPRSLCWACRCFFNETSASDTFRHPQRAQPFVSNVGTYACIRFVKPCFHHRSKAASYSLSCCSSPRPIWQPGQHQLSPHSSSHGPFHTRLLALDPCSPAHFSQVYTRYSLTAPLRCSSSQTPRSYIHFPPTTHPTTSLRFFKLATKAKHSLLSLNLISSRPTRSASFDSICQSSASIRSIRCW